MQSVDHDNKDVMLFEDWKIVFSQIQSRCKYWILNPGNKLPKDKFSLTNTSKSNSSIFVVEYRSGSKWKTNNSNNKNLKVHQPQLFRIAGWIIIMIFSILYESLGKK